MSSCFAAETHSAGFCVVGGGIAGLVMALACARNGFRTILMHDRPTPGGNGSGECRVQISGADRLGQLPNLRETGILEELRLENCGCNPNASYSVWDMVLWGAAEREPNLEVIYNCSCFDAEMQGNRLKAVTGWQTTTQKRIRVEAELFADSSGDAVLAPLTGAEFRVGREARSEFGESIGPEAADRGTMGMSCIFQTRRHDTPQPFEKPDWAYTYSDDSELPFGAEGHRNLLEGYWWVELGGEDDSIADTEKLRPELLKILLGVWDHIKNRGDHGAENLALEWLQFLPSKRESRRYVGDHILTQRDIEAEGKFADTVAYGGWTMDDHNPAGFRAVNLDAPLNIHHPAPSPYGIPYRCLYSRNIENLFVGGRCVSVTHAALSSTRVIGTCASMAQAAGTAAAFALRHGISPREVGKRRLNELQQLLLRQDCYLPGVPLRLPEYEDAHIAEEAGALLDGWTRPIGAEPHMWRALPGGSVTAEWPQERRIDEVSIIFESGLWRRIALVPGNPDCLRLPPELPESFRVELKHGGRWELLAECRGNRRRFVRIPAGTRATGCRLTMLASHGAPEMGVHALLF